MWKAQIEVDGEPEELVEETEVVKGDGVCKAAWG